MKKTTQSVYSNSTSTLSYNTCFSMCNLPEMESDFNIFDYGFRVMSFACVLPHTTDTDTVLGPDLIHGFEEDDPDFCS